MYTTYYTTIPVVVYTYTDVTCHLDGRVWNGTSGGQRAHGRKYYRSYKLVC